MDEEEQIELAFKNARIRIENLYTTIDTTVIPLEQESQKGKLVRELKKWKRKVDGKRLKEVQLEQFNNWMLDAESWFQSFRRPELSTVVIPQLIIYLIFFFFKLTPLVFVGYLYDICLPMILMVQGELWENGLGQYINITENSHVNRITIFIFLLISVMGIISLASIYGLSYEWFLISLVIYTIVIMGILTKWVYVLIDFIRCLVLENMDDYEKQKDPYKYGWHYVHLPILTILFSLVIGFIGYFIVHGAVSMTVGSMSIGSLSDYATAIG